MPLETGTYVSDLNASNPAHTDGLNNADGHMRLIKSTLKNTFPNFTGAPLNATQVQLDDLVAAVSGPVYSLVDGTSGSPTFSWGNEPTSGWRRTAAGTFVMSILGTDVAQWTTAGVDLGGGDIFSGGVPIFPLQAVNIGAFQVINGALAAQAVTYNKIQNAVGGSVLLGAQTASASFSEITLGTGLSMTSSVLNVALTVPPVSEVVNLLIVNDGSAPTTKVNVTADQVILLDASNVPQRYFGFSGSVDFTTTGAGGCDVGTRAATKGYYLWLIGNGSVCNVVATLDTNASPTMPSGYTAKRLAGWVHTDSSSNLYRQAQRGRRGKNIMVPGSTNSTTLPLLASGVSMGSSSGGQNSPTYGTVSLANFAPPNAVAVTVIGVCGYNGATANPLGIAPSVGYGGPASSNPPPLFIEVNSSPCSQSLSYTLETFAVCVWSSGTGLGAAAFLQEWELPV